MRATIVYGFLGAGKTTLLRSLVPRLAAVESTALLVNEFGIEGVDQVVLASDDLTVRQLVGGCVCCEVRGDLMVALDEIHRAVRPDRLVIEPTGLASPDTLAHVFASPSVRSIVLVDSIITVLDATRYALVRDHLGEFFPNQVRHADLVLVNKADAASDAQRRDARAWARGLNPGAAIVDSVYCKVDSDLLLAAVRQGDAGRTRGALPGRPSPQPSPRETFAEPGQGLRIACAPGELPGSATPDSRLHGNDGSVMQRSPRGRGGKNGRTFEGRGSFAKVSGRGRKSGPLTAGSSPGQALPSRPGERPLRNPSDGRPEDPHPNPLPEGEGVGAVAALPEGEGVGAAAALPEGEGVGAAAAARTRDVDFDDRVPHDDLAASGLERLVLDTGALPAERVDTFVGDLAAGAFGDVVRAKGFVPDAAGCALVDVVLGAWEVRTFGPAPLYIDVIGRNLNTNEMELALTHGSKELARTA